MSDKYYQIWQFLFISVPWSSTPVSSLLVLRTSITICHVSIILGHVSAII